MSGATNSTIESDQIDHVTFWPNRATEWDSTPSFKVLLTERRAVENYFTDAAVKAVKGEKYAALEPYQRLDDSTLPWAKAENWKIAGKMTRDDLLATDIGRFLQQLWTKPRKSE